MKVYNLIKNPNLFYENRLLIRFLVKRFGFYFCLDKRKSKRLDFRLELEVTKGAHLLFKVINERYNRDKSLIFTINVEEPDWADYLGDPISTTAIQDRIFHHSIRVEVRGPSYRKYEGELLQQKYAQKEKNHTS